MARKERDGDSGSGISGKRDKSWREIDAQRGKSKYHSRQDDPGQQRIERSATYEKYKQAADSLFTGGVLPDGRYRATVRAAGIIDAQGNAMLADHVINFRFLVGDADNDGPVNLNDFNILAANFGASPRDFTQGDFNYDSTINLSDFNLLAARFGNTVATATASAFSRAGDAADEDDYDLLEE